MSSCPKVDRSWQRPFVGLVAMMVGLLVLAACSTATGSDGSAERDRGSRGRVDPTVHDEELDRAVRFVRSQRDSVDVPSLLVFDYQARRWNVTRLAGFRRYALTVAGATAPANAFVRMFGSNHHASAAALGLLRSTDRLTAVALECEHSPLPAKYADVLRAAVTAGGYEATHVLLALGWIRELGCSLPSASSIGRVAVDRVSAELGQAPAVNDLSLEQSCFLGYAGAARDVRPHWSDQVRRAQRADGGWAEDPSAAPVGDHDPTRSNWHTTGLGLCSLLFSTSPGAAATRMVPA